MLKNIHAILLAAGSSRRMGELNKLLLPVRGQAMLRDRAEMLLTTQISGLTVVLGYAARHSAQVLQGLPVTQVFNPDYLSGRMSSVHWGLQQAPAAAGYLLCLADQVWLQAEEVNFLLTAFAQAAPERILVPEFEGQRGNPVLLSAQHRAAVLAFREQGGCRAFIATHPQYVTRVAMPNAHVLQDIDSPEDYAALSG